MLHGLVSHHVTVHVDIPSPGTARNTWRASGNRWDIDPGSPAPGIPSGIDYLLLLSLLLLLLSLNIIMIIIITIIIIIVVNIDYYSGIVSHW